MGRLIAVGDIHGEYEYLLALFEKIAPQPDDEFVFLGDYIDRGPSSREVIDYLLFFQQYFSAICLRGNHEDMLLDYFHWDTTAQNGKAYAYNGSGATIQSYCGKQRPLSQLRLEIPMEHKRFLKQLPLFYRKNNFLFVHAGLRPGIPFEKQNREDLLWIRHHFTMLKIDFPFTVVAGHNPQENVFISPEKILLDTGSGHGGVLSAIDVMSGKIYQAGK